MNSNIWTALSPYAPLATKKFIKELSDYEISITRLSKKASDAEIIVDISLHAFHEVCHFQGIQLACATGYGFGLSTYGHLFAQKFLAVEIMYVLHTVSGAPIFLSCVFPETGPDTSEPLPHEGILVEGTGLGLAFDGEGIFPISQQA